MIQAIAIGTLALLALSSVMSPKAFRMLLGALGVVLAMVVTLSFAIANYSPERNSAPVPGIARIVDVGALYRQLFGPTFAEAKQEATEKALNAAPETTQRIEWTVHSQPILVPDKKPKTGVRVMASIVQHVDSYLDSVRKANPENSELERLQARDLNLTLLNFVEQRGDAGARRIFVAFDDAFKQHIRVRARQLGIRSRLTVTVYVCFAIGIAMCIVFGLLKVINARQRVSPERDLLRLSGISMR